MVNNEDCVSELGPDRGIETQTSERESYQGQRHPREVCETWGLKCCPEATDFHGVWGCCELQVQGMNATDGWADPVPHRGEDRRGKL